MSSLPWSGESAEFGNPWMSNLTEITLPAPVAWTPQTVGWFGLAGVALIVLVVLAVRARRRWLGNEYRRTALVELAEIARLAEEPDTRPQSLQALPGLLKRVALATYSRGEVARLSGDAWLRFLDGSLASSDFTSGAGRRLPELAYDPNVAGRLPDPDVAALVALCRRWIRGHRSGGA